QTANFLPTVLPLSSGRPDGPVVGRNWLVPNWSRPNWSWPIGPVGDLQGTDASDAEALNVAHEENRALHRLIEGFSFGMELDRGGVLLGHRSGARPDRRGRPGAGDHRCRCLFPAPVRAEQPPPGAPRRQRALP